MTYEEAEKILAPVVIPQGLLGTINNPNNSSLPSCVVWVLGEKAAIKGHFTADELEAIAVFMRGENG